MEGAYVREALTLVAMVMVVSGVAPASAAIDAGEQIRCGSIGTISIGEVVTLSGTANLAAGDRVLIDVIPASFGPADKTEAREFSGTSGMVTVENGADARTWSMDIDTTGWTADTCIVTIESVDTGASSTTRFTLVEPTPAPPPETVPTPTPPPPSTEPTASPAPSAPGCGILAALAAAGTSALLAPRRR